MFSWFSRRASSAGGNGVRGRGDGGCGMDWEGDDCSSTSGGGLECEPDCVYSQKNELNGGLCKCFGDRGNWGRLCY